MSKNKSGKSNKVNLASQNVDTTVAAVNTDDTQHYEQKNMPKGAFNKNRGSK